MKIYKKTKQDWILSLIFLAVLCILMLVMIQTCPAAHSADYFANVPIHSVGIAPQSTNYPTVLIHKSYTAPVIVPSAPMPARDNKGYINGWAMQTGNSIDIYRNTGSPYPERIDLK